MIIVVLVSHVVYSPSMPTLKINNYIIYWSVSHNIPAIVVYFQCLEVNEHEHES
jgi:hypothetical protein